MKKFRLPVYLCLLLTCLNLGITAYFCSRYGLPPFSRPANPGMQAPPTSDAYVPDSISLAGEPLPMHRPDVLEAYSRELIVNTYLHSHTIQILKNAPRYFPVIEPILKREGIPDDFKYLAVIESRLSPTIVSPAGAVGIWQIMKATGKEFGLEVDDEVDERYHLEKATEAACRYLKKAYARFGSWTLAAASYNAGMRMVGRQMESQREDHYYNLLLGEETERYIYRILAMKQIMQEPEEYNFYVYDVHDPEPVTHVQVNGRVKSWADFARAHGITYKTLKRFNPWLRKPYLKNPRHRSYSISIPLQTELYR